MLLKPGVAECAASVLLINPVCFPVRFDGTDTRGVPSAAIVRPTNVATPMPFSSQFGPSSSSDIIATAGPMPALQSIAHVAPCAQRETVPRAERIIQDLFAAHFDGGEDIGPPEAVIRDSVYEQRRMVQVSPSGSSRSV